MVTWIATHYTICFCMNPMISWFISGSISLRFNRQLEKQMKDAAAHGGARPTPRWRRPPRRMRRELKIQTIPKSLGRDDELLQIFVFCLPWIRMCSTVQWFYIVLPIMNGLIDDICNICWYFKMFMSFSWLDIPWPWESHDDRIWGQ